MLHLKGKGNWPLNTELHVEIILCTAADFKSFHEYVMFFYAGIIYYMRVLARPILFC